jgi:hypothetical protein
MSADIYHVDVLASGYLPAAKATLYTAPTGKRVIVKTITIVSEDAGNRVVNLYVNNSGTSRGITPFNMILGPGYKGVDDDNHTLYDGDTIEGDCDAASTVSYAIEGAVAE